MAINRIYHQHFGEFHPKADRALKVFSPVFYEVLRFMDAFLDLLGLRFETSLDQRWSASVHAHRVIGNRHQHRAECGIREDRAAPTRINGGHNSARITVTRESHL